MRAMTDWRRWLTDKYIYLMLGVFPLFVGFSGYSRLTVSKYVFLLIATGVWLAGLAFLSVRKRSLGIRLRPVHYAALAFFAVCCLSALLSEYGTQVLLGAGRYDGLITIAVYVLIFLGVSAYGGPRRGYVYALGLSTLLTCLVALVQLFGINSLSLFPNSWNYYDAGTLYTSEFLGTIGNTNLLSGFLCLSLPLLAAVFISARDTQSLLFLLPLTLGFFVLTASGVSGGMVGLAVCAFLAAPVVIGSLRRLSRALFALSLMAAAAALATAFTAVYANGFVTVKMVFGKIPLALLIFAALLAILGILVILGRERFAPLGKKLRLVLGIGVAAAVIIAFAAVYFIPFSEGSTLYEISAVLHGNADDSFGSSRIQIWRAVLELVPEHWLLGGGPDTLAARLDVNFSRYVPETGATLSTFVDNAHNEYLGYLANVGVLGLGAYLTMLAMTLVRWIRRRNHAGIYAALGCALVGYWTQSFFGLGLCVVAPMMWLLWGLMEGEETDARAKETKRNELENEELKEEQGSKENGRQQT